MGLELKLHHKAGSLAVDLQVLLDLSREVQTTWRLQRVSMLYASVSHTLFCEGLFKEGAKCYSSYSGCINNGSNCVCEDKFVGETKFCVSS